MLFPFQIEVDRRSRASGRGLSVIVALVIFGSRTFVLILILVQIAAVFLSLLPLVLFMLRMKNLRDTNAGMGLKDYYCSSQSLQTGELKVFVFPYS